MTWKGNRPLESDEGRALATELIDSPQQAALVVRGALEALATHPPHPQFRAFGPEQAHELRAVYLRGLAAAAIVADVACAERAFTSVMDYSLHGEAVMFLPSDRVGLGLITQALNALENADSVVHHLALNAHTRPVPEGHERVLALVRGMLAQAARVRLARQRPTEE